MLGHSVKLGIMRQESSPFLAHRGSRLILLIIKVKKWLYFFLMLDCFKSAEITSQRVSSWHFVFIVNSDGKVFLEMFDFSNGSEVSFNTSGP